MKHMSAVFVNMTVERLPAKIIIMTSDGIIPVVTVSHNSIFHCDLHRVYINGETYIYHKLHSGLKSFRMRRD